VYLLLQPRCLCSCDEYRSSIPRRSSLRTGADPHLPAMTAAAGPAGEAPAAGSAFRGFLAGGNTLSSPKVDGSLEF